MTVIVYVQPAETPPPPFAAFSPLTMTYTGWNGTVWNLYSDDVSAMGDGITGTHFPAFTDNTSQQQHGQRFRGFGTQPRSTSWVVRVAGQSSEGWLALDSEVWESFHPAKPGVWTVQTPAGLTRRLPMRLQSDGNHSWSEDPSLWGRDEYAVTMIADQPFWLGEKIQWSWAKVDPVPFFGGLTGDGNLWISQGSTTNGATMLNPGNVAVSPVLTIVADGADVTITITIGDGVLECPTVPDGSTLFINTDPGDAYAELDGVDVSGALGDWDTREIEPGMAIPIGLDMTGIGTITAEIEPKYFRALG